MEGEITWRIDSYFEFLIKAKADHAGGRSRAGRSASHFSICHKPTATSASQARAVTKPINIVSISFPKKAGTIALCFLVYLTYRSFT